VRAMSLGNRWVFNSRRYYDSSKRSAKLKFRKDVRQANIAKVYYSTFRQLDPILERKGLGRPIDLVVPVIDIDADGNHEFCEYNTQGICIHCMKEATRKLNKVLLKLKTEPKHILFSGSKGWHVYLDTTEINEKELIKIVEHINSEEELVDDFSFIRDGEKHWDMMRIFKLPNTIDATTAMIVGKDLQRVEVNDEICEPLRQ